MSRIKSRLTVFSRNRSGSACSSRRQTASYAPPVLCSARSRPMRRYSSSCSGTQIGSATGRRSKADCQEERPRTRKSAAARRHVRPASAASAPARSRLYSLRVSRTGSKNARAAAYAVRPNRPEGLRSARKSAAKSTAATDFAQRKAQRFYFPLCFLFYASALSKAASGRGRWSSSARSTLQ